MIEVSEAPKLILEMLLDMYDWNYMIISQKIMSQQTLQYPRGYILSGCSVHSKSPVPFCHHYLTL